MKLTEYLIEMTDCPSYRAGTLKGMRHPAVDGKMIRRIGGKQPLLDEANELEKEGLIHTDRRDMNRDILCIHYRISDVPALCRRAGKEDPREKQLRQISSVKKWSDGAKGSFLEKYYQNLLERLEAGQQIKQPDLEDTSFFLCLNQITKIEAPIWRNQFSSRVFNNSKLFKEKYQKKVVTVLGQYSPLSAEGMSDDDILRMHGIKTYSQTLEWKGPLVYRIDPWNQLIDSSVNCLGTVINAQTLENAEPVDLSGIHRILLIENKANYESMPYRADTLYIFCHGFFSPKELRFLGSLEYLAEEGTEFFHWGDMDLGGIRIFLYNQKKLFPELKPWKMDKEAYEYALAKGAGIPLVKEKKEKLGKMDAGCLEELKNCILEHGMIIEQESLIE